VAIDERRRPFRESLVPVHPPGEEPGVTEVWFAGVHSDVGGGFADDDHPELGKISMRWMLDGAIDAGLLVRRQAYRNRYTLSEVGAQGQIHHNGLLWRIAGSKRRRIPDGTRLHGSVHTRMAADAKYCPRLPTTYTWEDEQWWGAPTFPAK
jgi:hypothetical protein